MSSDKQCVSVRVWDTLPTAWNAQNIQMEVPDHRYDGQKNRALGEQCVVQMKKTDVNNASSMASQQLGLSLRADWSGCGSSIASGGGYLG